jgi:hypothetical protein
MIMRYQITGSWGWPIGDKVIPGGTILNFDDDTDWWAQLAKKNGMLPMNVLALDQPAWDQRRKYFIGGYDPVPGPDVRV